MNRFIDILNRIRQNAKTELLTPSQKKVYDLLRERLKFLDELNLWGEHGVGKTFIGWVMNQQGLAIYAPYIYEIDQTQSQPRPRTIIVDNMDWKRIEVRETLLQCRMQGFAKIVLITTEPVQDQIATVELHLNNEDVAKAIVNLRSIGIAPNSDKPHNLWDLVSPISLHN